MPYNWTEEHIQQLRTMWESGRTAASIGNVLGITRNAVIGKAYRLQLLRHQPAVREPVKEPVQNAYEIKKETAKNKLPTYHRGLTPRPLDSLKLHECRYPVNKPKFGELHLFCGRQTEAAKSYCPEHHSIVWRKVPKHWRK